MKKIGALILLILLGVSFASAQNLGEIRDSAQKIKDSIESKEALKNFIQEEWKSYTETSEFGKTLVKIENALTSADPFFRYIIGLEFSWSIPFFLTLLLWIAFAISISRALTIFTKASKSLNFILSLVAIIFISAIGITRIIATIIIDIITALPNWSLQVVASVIALTTIIFIITYSNLIKKATKREALKQKIEKAAQTAKEAKRAVTRPKKKSREVTKEDIEEMARQGIEGISADEGH